MNSEFTIAVHSLVLLAYKPDHMATSDEIAKNVCTHPARVRKVLSLLRKSGYVQAKEGSGGGFLLAVSPEHVTLADIYNRTSLGSFQPTWCSGDESLNCLIAANMAKAMDGLCKEAEQHTLAFFQNITLSDMLARLKLVQQEDSYYASCFSKNKQ